MNIVILSDGAALLGGAEKVAFLSARELARRGFFVTLFCAVGPIDPMLEGIDNLEVVCLDHRLTREATSSGDRAKAFLRHMWNREAAQAFDELLVKLDPKQTIVHAHCYQAMLSASTISVALSRGFRFVTTMHDYGLACPLRNFYHARENAICTRKPLGISCICTECTGKSYGSKARALATQIVHNVRGRIAPRLRNVIFVSDFSRRVLLPFLEPGTHEEVVRNPIDANKRPRTNAEANHACVYLGRMVPEKDPCTLATACRLANVPAVFVGSGPEEAKVRECNPDAEVTGWVPPGEVYSRLSTARSFAIPSIWYECSPLSTLEALASGLPVLTSNSNASVDDVRHGENGFVFPSRNPEALASRLTELKDNDLALRMSENAYDGYWRAPQSIESHVDALTAYYDRLID